MNLSKRQRSADGARVDNQPSDGIRVITAERKLKTYHIELKKLKAAAQGNGLVEFSIDAQVLPRPAVDDRAPTSVLSMDEANARVLLSLLKTQLGEFDKRKARSRH